MFKLTKESLNAELLIPCWLYVRIAWSDLVIIERNNLHIYSNWKKIQERKSATQEYLFY